MAKLTFITIGLFALSACATLSPAESARRDRARAVALAYLAKHHLELPAGFELHEHSSIHRWEVGPPSPYYGVGVLAPLRGKLELLYDIWIDPRDWTVEEFCDMRRTDPPQFGHLGSTL
jgi:hypothetical protein